MSSLIPTVKNGSDKGTSLGFRALPTFSSWLDEIFDNGIASEFGPNFNRGLTLPAVNVIDSADSFLVEMAIPGMSKSDFNINLDNQFLTISAEKNLNTEEKGDERYTRREFGYSSFKRSFSLPDTVNSEKIGAKYEDGILKVMLPKREEAKKKPVRNIKIS